MKALLLATALVLPAAAHAGELAPNAGMQKTLRSGASATIYFTTETDGYHVVATVQSDATEAASVFRFTTTLAPGQSAEISVPRAAGESADAILIRRSGERLLVEDGIKLSSVAD